MCAAKKTNSFVSKASETLGLAKLEENLRKDFDYLSYPTHVWTQPRKTTDGNHIYDVVIIGAGQGGLSIAFGLMQEKVNNILVVDENPEGYEGPWLTFARMITLRTPKYIIGPDYGIPNLTVRAWYEAQWGEKSWKQMTFLPKELWAAYLKWYRKFLQIPVQNNTRAGTIEWMDSEQCFLIPVTTNKDHDSLFARKIILATGIDGSGRWDVPDQVRDYLPRRLYAHTRDKIDFNKLAGKRVGVLGAGASAFDNASVALEMGAKEVHLFFRRRTLPTINTYRWAEFVGFLKHHADLSDAQRWSFISKILDLGQLPPSDTYARATKFANFHLHGQSPWQKVEAAENSAIITTPQGKFEFDFLIIGTGFVTDLSVRPELAGLYPHIALWADRYTPPKSEKHEDLARHPYLGSNFEFLEKTPGNAPYLKSVFNYTFGCLPSLGFGGSSISGMKYSLPKVIAGVTRQLYLEDWQTHYQSLATYTLQEFKV